MCKKREEHIFTYFVLQCGPRGYCITVSDSVYDSHSVYAHLNYIHFNLLRRLTIQPTGKEKVHYKKLGLEEHWDRV